MKIREKAHQRKKSLTDGTVSLEEETGMEAAKCTYSKTLASAVLPGRRNLEQILDALLF